MLAQEAVGQAQVQVALGVDAIALLDVTLQQVGGLPDRPLGEALQELPRAGLSEASPRKIGRLGSRARMKA